MNKYKWIRNPFVDNAIAPQRFTSLDVEQFIDLLSDLTWKSIYSPRRRRRRRRRLKGIHSRSDTNRTGAEGLSLYYPRLLHCLDQMLAVMSLSQHRVSSSKTVRPRAPCGARCIGHAVSTWSAVCSEAPHSQFVVIYNPDSITFFWITARFKFPLVSCKALRILIPFVTSYLCEAGFSSVAVIKSKYRNKIDIQREMRVAISNIEPRFNKACMKQQAQCSH